MSKPYTITSRDDSDTEEFSTSTTTIIKPKDSNSSVSPPISSTSSVGMLCKDFLKVCYFING